MRPGSEGRSEVLPLKPHTCPSYSWHVVFFTAENAFYLFSRNNKGSKATQIRSDRTDRADRSRDGKAVGKATFRLHPYEENMRRSCVAGGRAGPGRPQVGPDSPGECLSAQPPPPPPPDWAFDVRGRALVSDVSSQSPPQAPPLPLSSALSSSLHSIRHTALLFIASSTSGLTANIALKAQNSGTEMPHHSAANSHQARILAGEVAGKSTRRKSSNNLSLEITVVEHKTDFCSRLQEEIFQIS